MLLTGIFRYWWQHSPFLRALASWVAGLVFQRTLSGSKMTESFTLIHMKFSRYIAIPIISSYKVIRIFYNHIQTLSYTYAYAVFIRCPKIVNIEQFPQITMQQLSLTKMLFMSINLWRVCSLNTWLIQTILRIIAVSVELGFLNAFYVVFICFWTIYIHGPSVPK